MWCCTTCPVPRTFRRRTLLLVDWIIVVSSIIAATRRFVVTTFFLQAARNRFLTDNNLLDIFEHGIVPKKNRFYFRELNILLVYCDIHHNAKGICGPAIIVIQKCWQEHNEHVLSDSIGYFKAKFMEFHNSIVG